MIPKLTLEKFMRVVYPEPNTGCWIWCGGIVKTGYGNCVIRFDDGRRLNRAHRVSYYFHNGDFDFNLHVLHTCDNRFCVNPEHLYLGTHQDNMKDRTKRGKTYKAYGEKSVVAAFSDKQVVEIRQNKLTARQIANKYKVSYFTGWDIINGRSYRHLL